MEGPEGPEGAGGTGGHERAWLQCPWAVAETNRQHTNDKPRPIRGRRGACGAWPGFETTRRATHQRPGAAGVEGAGGARDSTSSVTFNIIGRIQPDQKGLNLPDQVYASPQQAFS